MCDSNIDADRDGVDDRFDNCLGVSNPSQLDTNVDGEGDECDTDDDGDGVDDKCLISAPLICQPDNCVKVYNPDQLDSDGTCLCSLYPAVVMTSCLFR